MANVLGGRIFMPLSNAQTGAQLKADLVQCHSSRARYFAEFAAGQNVMDDTVTPCAPTPPHSVKPGHDHSGGLMGTPIIRPLFSAVFGGINTALSTAVTYGRAPCARVTAADVDRNMMIFDGAFKHVWVPGCPTDGAHFSAIVQATAWLELGGAGSSQTLHTMYGNGSLVHSGSGTMVDTEYTSMIFTEPLLLKPGQFNTVMFRAWLVPSNAITMTVHLLSVSINQTSSTS